MIADLKPYPAYKKSGVPWLGDVPEHWEVQRLKHICRFNYGDSLPAETRYSGEVPVFGSNGRVGSHVSSNTKAPCIVIGRKGSFGKVKFSAEPVFAIDTTFYVDGRFTNADVRWLSYLLSWLRLDEVSKDSAVPGLDREDAYRRMAAYPAERREQSAIVRFLDHADRRIRRYIHAKQKLIKLLEEQKQAIIHRAVTRGLDSTVRLKPSGVEWLGDVPEHWVVSQIRSIAHVVRGGSPRPAGSSLYFHGTGAPWITVGEITKDPAMYLEETSTRLTPAGAEQSRMIEAGTLLLTNSGATLGIPKISLIQGCINDGVAAFLNLRARVKKEFLYLYWSTQTVHLKAWVDLGAQPNLNTQIIGGWPVPLPPTVEQEAIVQCIQQETVLLTDAIERAQREIDLLREYRTTLIADVVTGKLDVRDAATKLLDETAEPESLDADEPLVEAEEDTDNEDVALVSEGDET